MGYIGMSRAGMLQPPCYNRSHQGSAFIWTGNSGGGGSGVRFYRKGKDAELPITAAVGNSKVCCPG